MGAIETALINGAGIAFLVNRFTTKKIPEAIAFLRFKGVAGDKMWMRTETTLKPPAKFKPKKKPHFWFRHTPDRDIKCATDIPLGVWYVPSAKVKSWDAVKFAQAAPCACIFYVRFQKSVPKVSYRLSAMC